MRDHYEVSMKNDRGHQCHWPTCTLYCAPAFWGCKRHWFMLPKHLRDRLWKHYIKGQEIYKTPLPEYMEAAREAETWALLREMGIH